MEVNFILPFKAMPAVRMTQASKHVNERAKAYLAWKIRAGYEFKEQMAGRDMLPGQTPLAVAIRIEHSGGFHNRDLDNEAKAILDAAEGIVFPNDRWVDVALVGRVASDIDQVTIWIDNYTTGLQQYLAGFMEVIPE